MRIEKISPRRKNFAAIKFSPSPKLDLSGALYEGENLLIDREILARLSLCEGEELSETEVQQLVVTSECYRAKQRAVWYLSSGDMSEKGLYQKLCRTFTPAAAAFAVEQMIKKGYLKELNFARRLLRQGKDKNLSKRAIKNKLFEKGISPEVIQEVLEEWHEGDVSSLCQLLETKYATQLSGEDFPKTVAALQRRGFSYADIKTALIRLHQGEELW